MERSISRSTGSPVGARLTGVLLALTLACGAAAADGGFPGGGPQPEDETPKTVRTVLSANILAEVDLQDAKSAMEVWTRVFSSRWGENLKSEVVILRHLSEIRRYLRTQRVSYILVLADEYLQLEDEPKITPAFITTGPREAMDEFVVLARKESSVADLKSLAGKKIVIQVGGLGAVPRMWVDTMLAKQGLPTSREHCAQVQEVQKASRAVLPVFFGQADVGVALKRAFDTMVELNPQIGKRIRVIARSPRYLRAVCCFGPSWKRNTREEVKRAVLTMHRNPRGRHLLALFGYKRAAEFEASALASLRALRKDYRTLVSRAAKPDTLGSGATPTRAGGSGDPDPVWAGESVGAVPTRIERNER